MNENPTANAPGATPENVSPAVRKAIEGLNACCKSRDAAGNITFKVHHQTPNAAFVEPQIRSGLKELGMGCGARFINLGPRAVKHLQTFGLDVSDAYDIVEAKGMAQTINRAGETGWSL